MDFNCNVFVCNGQLILFTSLGPLQLYGSVAGPGSHPGSEDSGAVAGGQDPEGLGRGQSLNSTASLSSLYNSISCLKGLVQH